MLKPIGKNILIQKVKKEQKKGKLILTSNIEHEPSLAVIIDIGSKADIELKIGDTILVVPYAGSNISLEDDGYFLITERDILGVIV